MKPIFRVEAKLNEILNLLQDKVVSTNIHRSSTPLKIDKEPETFISLGGNCTTAHSILLPHRKFSLPLDSFGSPSLKDAIDLIEQVKNGCFDYESFFEPSLTVKHNNTMDPSWSMIHWIPDLKTIKNGNYDKNKVIETFKRRFERLMSLKNEPQNFVYLSHKNQIKIKKLSEVLEQVERLSLIFKIKQFIYVSFHTLCNDTVGLFNTNTDDDLKDFKDENPYLNENSIKWRNNGIPKYFKYYQTTLGNSVPEYLLLQLRSLNFYEETGIIEQTERIDNYIQKVKII